MHLISKLCAIFTINCGEKSNPQQNSNAKIFSKCLHVQILACKHLENTCKELYTLHVQAHISLNELWF